MRYQPTKKRHERGGVTGGSFYFSLEARIVGRDAFRSFTRKVLLKLFPNRCTKSGGGSCSHPEDYVGLNLPPTLIQRVVALVSDEPFRERRGDSSAE